MAEFCYVVERVEWDQHLETGDYWEDRQVCRVCRNYEDAKSFVESNSKDCPYPMRWQGDRRYSGHYLEHDGNDEGLRYEIHYVPLH